MKRLLLIALLFAAVLALPIQADFFQCADLCTGSDNDDVMNGSPIANFIEGGLGNDLMFGGDENDSLFGDDLDPVDGGNDVIFGGLGSDSSSGGPGNDTFIPGPDEAGVIQSSLAESGNDTFIVLVGETVNCQLISGGADFDVLHLIGFGPYVAEYPYGATPPIAINSYIVIQDPIAGGFIFVEVSQELGTERINGLATPNLAVIDFDAFNAFRDLNCIEDF